MALSYGPDGGVINDEPEQMLVLTGPVTGQVELADGTTYNVSAPHILIDPAHFGELGHHIGVRLEATGHISHTDGQAFVHTCDEYCGDLAREN